MRTRALFVTTLFFWTSCLESTSDPTPPAEAAIEGSMPLPRGGADILGKPFDFDSIERWIGEPLNSTPASGPRATLVRFWTDTCPFCEASLPALQGLADEFRDQGLATLGVYHPKPPHDVTEEEVIAAARQRQYAGPLAIDRDWNALNQVWLDTGKRGATSASFLLDQDGLIRFVHPGPVFHPAGEDHGLPAHAEQAARDYATLRQAIRSLLEGG